MNNLHLILLCLIAAIGSGALIGVFRKMGKGFGPYNLRVVGIVLVATFASMLAVVADDAINAAMGILGAIAGYLFGLQNDRPAKEKEKNDEG